MIIGDQMKKSAKGLAALLLAVGIAASMATPAQAATVSCQAKVIAASATVLTIDNSQPGGAVKCYQVQARAYRYSSGGGYTVVTGSLSTSSSSVTNAGG